MLTYLDESTADEMEDQLSNGALVSVWLVGGDYYLITNIDDRRSASHILAGAVLEAIRQDHESPQ